MALLLVAIIVLASCVSPTAQPTTQPSNQPSVQPSVQPTTQPGVQSPTKPTPQAGTIQLSVAYYMAPMSWISTLVFIPWKNAVEQATNGRVNVTLYPSGSIATAADTYDATNTGLCDIGWGLPGFSPGRFPLTNFVGQPFLFPDVPTGSTVMYQMWQQSPEIQAEYKETHVLTLAACSYQLLMATKSPIHVPGDIKGKTIGTQTENQTKTMKAAGAVPVMLKMEDNYTSLSSKIVDGDMNDGGLLKDLKLADVAPYIMNMQVGNDAMYVVMNLNKWNSLPPDIQKIIGQDLGGLNLNQRMTAAKMQHVQMGLDYAKPLAKEIYVPTAAERDQWVAATKSVADQWIADMAAKGLPGQQIYNKAVGLSQQVSK